MGWYSRNTFLKGKISTDRINLLESIGFSWDPLEEEWQTKYKELQTYKEKYGNIDIPQGHPSLGLWVGTQRTRYKKGKQTKNRIVLLENLGFIWDKVDFEWKINFRKIKRYFSEHGHSNPPTIILKLVFGHLGKIIIYKGKINTRKIKLLESINFIWDIKKGVEK